MRKLISVILTLAIALMGAQAGFSATTVPDEQFALPMNAPGQSGMELQGISISDGGRAIPQPSQLVADPEGDSSQIKFRICKNISDEFCGKAKAMFFTAILAPCDEKIKINCVDGISATTSDGKVITGKLVKRFPSYGLTDFPADDSKNLPAGASPSLWTLEGLNNGGGTNQYLVDFTTNGSNYKDPGKFKIDRINASISPVTIIAGQYNKSENKDSRSAPANCEALRLACGMSTEGHSTDNATACASLDEGVCALRQAFPADTRFKLSVKLGNSPTGWFHGRLQSPTVDLNSENGIVHLSLEASPVVVPEVGILVPRSTLSPEMNSYYSQPTGGMSFGEPGPHGYRNQLSQPLPYEERAFTEFLMWASFFKDKASASPTEWDYRTLDLTPDVAQCFRDDSKFIGIVTTNSMIYAGGPPTLNPTYSTLDYKVASPHFTSRGEIFKGTYDLQIRSDVARCLYNYTSAPISANISVTNESGEQNVATTVVSEKDGWLRLAAYNFTFSNPTIRVKLIQAGISGAVAASKLTRVIKSGESCKVGDPQVPGVDDFGQIVYLSCFNSKYSPTSNSTVISAVDKARVLYLQRSKLPANQVIPREGNPCTAGSQWALGYSKKQTFAYLSCGTNLKFQVEVVYGGNPAFDKAVLSEFIKNIPVKKK